MKHQEKRKEKSSGHLTRLEFIVIEREIPVEPLPNLSTFRH